MSHKKYRTRSGLSKEKLLEILEDIDAGHERSRQEGMPRSGHGAPEPQSISPAPPGRPGERR